MTRYVLSNVSDVEVIGFVVVLALAAATLVYFAWRARLELRSLRIDRSRKFHSEKSMRISKLRGRVFALPVLSLMCVAVIWVVLFEEGFIGVSFNDQRLILEYRFQDPVALPWGQVHNLDLVARHSRRGRTSWRLDVFVARRVYSSVSTSDREERKHFEDVGKKVHAEFKRNRAAQFSNR